MAPFSLLVFLGLICVSSVVSEVGPRGNRPMEQGTRGDKCDTQIEWPFCTDDQWGPKCPSGCRIHGLMNKYDHALLKRIEKIRSLLDQNKSRYRNADQSSIVTYNYLKEKLTSHSGDGDNYFNLANNLRQRISDMKIKIDRQLRALASMKDRVKNQVDNIHLLEVDIDIRLRSCKGSCASQTEYHVDKESYVALDKHVNQLDAQSVQSLESVETLYVMKSQKMSGQVLEPIYKSGMATTEEKTEDMFPGVTTKQFILETEGSTAFPAKISKQSGTSYSHSTSSSATSTNSKPSKSITELDGVDSSFDVFGAFDNSQTHVSTKTLSCTKSIKTTIIQTPAGPKEHVEETIEGGPECQVQTTETRNGLNNFFPSLGLDPTPHVDHSKGSLFGDTKGVFENPFDHGLFNTDIGEDDLPDIHARSFKSVNMEKQADSVVTDCVEAHQHNLNGEKNGLFKIRPGGINSTEVVVVYCEQEGLMGGWLLVQQRESGALSFNRTWDEYRNGFGSVDTNGNGEFWLGNQNLHLLTSQHETMLKVEMQDWEGGKATAEYIVRVGPEEEGYPIQISGYTGNAGDALLNYHNTMKFSTFDKDNDNWAANCAEWYGGGWWYNSCQAANLNGIYYKGTYDPQKSTGYKIENGVVWLPYKPADYSLKHIRIVIRRSDF